MSPTGKIIDVVLHRRSILESICENKPDKRTLVETLPDSRPTVDRAVRELEEHNLVERVDGVCKPTYTGQMAYKLCEEFRNSFQMLNNTSAELSLLPLDSNLNKYIFLDGCIFHPPDYAPYQRIQPLDEDLRDGKKNCRGYRGTDPSHR
jgi:DNA-binding transcriptional MocR family regulator